MRITAKMILHAIVWTKRHLLGQLEVPAISAIKKFISPNDVCIDIGAHAGSWAIPLSKLVNKGHVYAFEALPYYSSVLKITLYLLGQRNITILNNAVIESKRPVKLIWKTKSGKKLTGKTHIASKMEQNLEGVFVDGITVDSFIKDIAKKSSRIRFVKMDIEGAELLALQGAKNLITDFYPIFYLEINNSYCLRYGYSINEIFDFISEYKYNSFIISPNLDLTPITSKNYIGNGDALFLPINLTSLPN